VLARLLLLVAVLLMPFGMAPASASTSDHVTMHMPAGHCPDQGSDGGLKAGIAACTMACAGALPASDALAVESIRVRREIATAVPVAPLFGLHPETATPPPKRS